jgi:hypothetical protein
MATVAMAMAVGVTIASCAALRAPNGRPVKPATSPTGTLQATAPSTPPASWQPIGLPAGFRATALSCPAAGVCVLLGAIDGTQTVEEYDAGSWTAAGLPATGHFDVNGLTCVTGADCWAVGTVGQSEGSDDTGTVTSPAIARDSGAGFQLVPSPPMRGADSLNAVACVDADDCWAVGSTGSVGGFVTMPASGPSCDDNGVITPCPTYVDLVVGQPLVEHYDGTAWIAETVPSPPSANLWLSGVGCLSADDCWAIGKVISVSSPGIESDFQGYALEHFDGGSWTLVDTPAIGGGDDSSLDSLTCVTADDCWAAGGFGPQHTAGGPLPEPVIEHDAGEGWVVVPSPEITAANGGSLSSLACLSADDCWALGFAAGAVWDLMGTPPPPTYWGQNVVEHYDGRSWSRVPSLELSMNTGTLGSITCPASGTCYAIGSAPAQGVEQSSQGLFMALTSA